VRIAFATLGCKINQYETDLLRQDLLSQGNAVVPFEGEADVYIINTCSVTAKSDAQCRRMIKAAVSRGQGARVVVTGCYAETRPGELQDIPGVDLVIGNENKASIPRRLLAFAPTTQGRADSPAPGVPAASVRGRTRGYLKIQTGCDNHCSYCIVPLARGGSRSASPAEVIKEFERLVGCGCPEIVLTGIHIGMYGNDLQERISLTDLLVMLLSKRGGARLRLSSIEPREVTDRMIGLLGNGLCRHLHIPLQSGDDTVLASMKRNYTSGFYKSLLGRIATDVPGTALGADVMVGYPGEGDLEFQNTLRLVEQAPLSHLHVFTYSPRPGTVAAARKDQVRDSIKKERSEELRSLGSEKNLAFRTKHVGSEMKVVVEDKRDAKTGLFSGLSDNYIRVLIDGAERELIGKEIRVRLITVEKEANFAIVT
jgi:threonylcarbamoyladenosine tRNA methylthiotransferase MtaB